MSGVTPSSIEQQLAEYRQRKQEEERNRAVLVSASSSSSPPPSPPLPSPPLPSSSGQLPWIFNLVLTSLRLVAIRVSGSLFAAVAPDHLQPNYEPVANGGQTLRGEAAPDASAVRRRVRQGMNSEEASSPLLGTNDYSTALLEDSDEDSDQSLERGGGIVLRIIKSRSKTSWAMLFLKCLLWFVLWEVFILWGFGAVYFLISGFLCIGYNLRNGPRLPGEVSAYSVFNKDLRRIEGTVTPEQLQREMLFRM